jgi:hypothetical protein
MEKYIQNSTKQPIYQSLPILKTKHTTDILYGHFSQDMEHFIIVDPQSLSNNKFVNGMIPENEIMYIKIQSIPWLQKEISNPASFSINAVIRSDSIGKPIEENMIKSRIETPNFKNKSFSLNEIIMNSPETSRLRNKKHSNTDIANYLENKEYPQIQRKSVSKNIPTNLIDTIEIGSQKIIEKVRQQNMLSEVQKNILNNINIKDSGNFYKNWLIEIHRKEKQIRYKKEKNLADNAIDQMTKKLEKIEDLFIENLIL